MKTYRILTLGASGSGKTVFLASMFKQLSIQGEDGFFLDANNHQKQKILNSVYTNLIAGEIWPTGTKYSEISEWSFTCRVRNVADFEDYPACKFVYFDYAGGRFTDMDEDDSELQETIKESDAILGLLDGQKILALMNNNSDPKLDIFLDKDLPAIIKWMSHCKVPIQFVISKWDLLENNFSLKQIRDRLLEIPQLEQLIRDQNKKGSPVRLIPVSSVGAGFAIPETDGSMKKIPGSIPHPFQVEVPLACVLPDKFEADLREIVKQQEKLSKKEPKLGRLLQTFRNIFAKATPGLAISGSVANEAIFNVFGTMFGTAGLVAMGVLSAGAATAGVAVVATSRFLLAAAPFIMMTKPMCDKLLTNIVRHQLDKIQKSTQKLSDLLQQNRYASLKKVKNQETAYESAIDSFLYIQNELYRLFPDSEIFLEEPK